VPSEASKIRAWSKELLKTSLDRLNVEKLYGLLLHRPGELLGKSGAYLYEAILELKAAGLVEKIGVSVYDEAELDAIFSKYKIDLVQAPFSIMDRRLVSSGWLRELSRNDVEVHARSVFLQGLLLMEPAKRPVYFKKWTDSLSAWDRWIDATQQTHAGACLRFALSFPEIGRAIVGVDSVDQLDLLLTECEKELLLAPDDLFSNDITLLNPSCWEIERC